MKMVGKRVHLILGVTIATSVFTFGAYLPKSRRLADLHGRIAGLERQVLAGGEQLRSAASMHAELTSALGELESFDEAVPASEDVGVFLEAVSQIADELGLTDRNIVPGKALASPRVSLLPIEMSFGGDFESLYAFLQRIESLPRVARVKRMETAVSEQDGALTCSLTVNVFFRNS